MARLKKPLKPSLLSLYLSNAITHKSDDLALQLAGNHHDQDFVAFY